MEFIDTILIKHWNSFRDLHQEDVTLLALCTVFNMFDTILVNKHTFNLSQNEQKKSKITRTFWTINQKHCFIYIHTFSGKGNKNQCTCTLFLVQCKAYSTNVEVLYKLHTS